MMTRKHFELLAKLVADLPADVRTSFAYNLADVLETTNPSFDYGRFLTACGVSIDSRASVRPTERNRSHA